MQLDSLYRWLRERYVAATLAHANEEIDQLLEAVCGITRAQRIAHPTRALHDVPIDALQAMVHRRQAGEPLAYILNRQAFWSFELTVTPAVLIPRGDTECLVEHALQRLPSAGTAVPCVLDAGTGSGAVAIALAIERVDVHVLACDDSLSALQVAAGNVKRLAPARVSLIHGHWLDWLADDSLDMLVSNPPYIAAGDPHLDQQGLWLEPYRALVANDDGRADLSYLCAQAGRVLRQGGWLLLEHGHEQARHVRAQLAGHGYCEIHSERDLAGHERVTLGRLGA